VSKNLIIVESPAKTRTLKKFLGAGYQVEASMGHIRDLVKKDMGIGAGLRALSTRCSARRRRW
jgi:DNA topoisomerase I